MVDTDSKLNNVMIARKTQENKTDLAFLSEIAKEYGFVFSIKGDKMVFMEHSTLDHIPSIIGIGKQYIERYSLTSKIHDTYAATTVKGIDHKTGKVVQSTVKSDNTNLPEWQKDTGSTDVLNLSGPITSGSQAYAYASAGLSENNRKGQTGNISLPGNPLLVAGINFDLEGFGRASGKCHITKSTHTVSSAGYMTSIDFERIGDIKTPGNKTVDYSKDLKDINKPLRGPEFNPIGF